jgi:hypothetical protein
VSDTGRVRGAIPAAERGRATPVDEPSHFRNRV